MSTSTIFSILLFTLALSGVFCEELVAGVAKLEAEARLVVERVNSANAGWTAEAYPHFARMTVQERRAMHGLRIPKRLIGAAAPKNEVVPGALTADADIPAEFDPRQQWPACADVINHVRDQSRCGDCWAVAAAGAFSDRICIASGGKTKISVSAIDTASCSMKGHDGCQGAEDLSPAWAYYHNVGVVSGSSFEDKAGCKPYPFPPSRKATRDYRTPRCSARCQSAYTAKSYKQDEVRAEAPIALQGTNEALVKAVQREVMAHGSVEVGFIVFSDFSYYKGGVYKHTWGEQEGGHAVRLVGWGVDKTSGTPYWLIANSWGSDWGEQGFFRIRRGTDEAYIESMTAPYAGMPQL